MSLLDVARMVGPGRTQLKGLCTRSAVTARDAPGKRGRVVHATRAERRAERRAEKRSLRRNAGIGATHDAKVRRVQPRVLDHFDSSYGPSLGNVWTESRAALLLGRDKWMYAAIRNRFGLHPMDHPADQPTDHSPVPNRFGGAIDGNQATDVHLPRRGGCLDRDAYGMLLGRASGSAPCQAQEGAELLNIAEEWPGTQLECYVSKLGAGRIFPRYRPMPGFCNPYWIMSATSIVPVLLLDAQPGDRVLDMCASPGGKSFLLLQHTDSIDLVVHDTPERGPELAETLRHFIPADVLDRAVTVAFGDGRNLIGQDGEGVAAGVNGGQFDRVLVDAPCSTDKHLIWSSDATVDKQLPVLGTFPGLQQELLCTALAATRPGGVVVYTTCTLDPRQNEDVVWRALHQMGDAFKEVPADEALDETLLRSFDKHFNIVRGYAGPATRTTRTRAGGLGLLVAPTCEKNWGPLFMAKIVRK